MVNLKILFSILLALLCMFVSMANAEMSSTSYRISTTVMSCGGNTMSSTNFNMMSTLGQPSPTGNVSSINYINNSGFLFTLLSAIVAGDVNGDGIVNLEDVITALQITTGQTLAGISLIADTDGDGRIGIVEAIMVLRKIGGLE